MANTINSFCAATARGATHLRCAVMIRLLSSLMAGDSGLNDGVPIVGHVSALCCCPGPIADMYHNVVWKFSGNGG